MFGLRRKELVKVVYSFDQEELVMSQNVTIFENEKFNGTRMKIEVTDEFVIISNSDGAEPGISFFNHSMSLVQFFNRSALFEAPYNLEVYRDPILELLQVFVAGPNTISIIEEARSIDGESFFNTLEDVFVSTDP